MMRQVCEHPFTLERAAAVATGCRLRTAYSLPNAACGCRRRGGQIEIDPPRRRGTAWTACRSTSRRTSRKSATGSGARFPLALSPPRGTRSQSNVHVARYAATPGSRRWRSLRRRRGPRHRRGNEGHVFNDRGAFIREASSRHASAPASRRPLGLVAEGKEAAPSQQTTSQKITDIGGAPPFPTNQSRAPMSHTLREVSRAILLHRGPAFAGGQVLP